MENEKKNLPVEAEITDSDFVYVQKDESISDSKFKTKPTTFFKDAMKRFAKSRSSVVAAGILLVLISMAIIVPIADGNNIEKNVTESRYLPPKWFSNDMNGFFDGTKKITNCVLDPHERTADGKYKLPSDSDYVQNAIIGDITASMSYADSLSGPVKKYGKGGSITVTNIGEVDTATNVWSGKGDIGILSPEITLIKGDTVSYTVALDAQAAKENYPEDNGLYAYLVFTSKFGGASDVSVNLTEPLKIDGDVSALSCADVNGKLATYFASLGEIKGNIGVMVAEPTSLAYSVQSLYVKSAKAEAGTSNVAAANFTDATNALSLLNDGDVKGYSHTGNTCKLDIYHSEVLYGTFRYDCYKAVFGSTSDDDPNLVLTPNKVYTKSDLDTFYKRGWIEEYNWGAQGSTTPGNFVLTELGKAECPLRRIVSQRNIVNPFMPDDNIMDVTGDMSFYRQLYYEGKIASCNIPHYVFGTDKNGLDFFKVVFSGLLLSLGLGVLSAGINIIIGLLWGATAGYFGGWVDMLMERFTEILGGMPWIVMMTLIVLLTGSSSFGIFLFALCITGWMGIAGTTRSQFYRYKRREYVLASRTLGASDGRLIFKHILPNSLGTIVTGAVLMIPGVIFTEANISYLLPGTMQLKGSFGVTLSDVQKDLNQYPYLIISASIVMALIMISFNLFGNGLRDAFNPSLKGSDE